MIRPPPTSPLFPYTTLFRSIGTGIHYPVANHQQPAVRKLYSDLPRLPKTETAVNEILSLPIDRKSTRLNSSHSSISYAVFCLKKKKNDEAAHDSTDTYYSPS